jgi:hypothetical protein
MTATQRDDTDEAGESSPDRKGYSMRTFRASSLPTSEHFMAEERAAAAWARTATWTSFTRAPMPDNNVWPALRNVVSTWQNSKYFVLIAEHITDWGLIRQVMVRPHHELPIRDWTDMQRIKNELIGPDAVAIEVYPAVGNEVDLANMYHMWVLPPGMVLPFGLHLHQ